MKPTAHKPFPFLYSTLMLLVFALWAAIYGFSDEVINTRRYGTLPKGLTPSLVYSAIALAYGIYKDWRISKIRQDAGANSILLLSKEGGFLIRLAAIETALLAPLATLFLAGQIDATTSFLALKCLYPVLMAVAVFFVIRNHRWIAGSILQNQKAKFRKKLYPLSAFTLVTYVAFIALSLIPYCSLFTSPIFPIMVSFIAAISFGNSMGTTLALFRYWRRNKA